MPRLDHCHAQVVHALEKDGWQITAAPRRYKIADRTIYVDLEASRRTNGRREEILLAEVKCFADEDSRTTDLYIAVGQYIIYRAVLKRFGVNTPLYLAIPNEIYSTIFDSSVLEAIKDSKIKLVIVNLEQEVVEQWIE